MAARGKFQTFKLRFDISIRGSESKIVCYVQTWGISNHALVTDHIDNGALVNGPIAMIAFEVGVLRYVDNFLGSTNHSSGEAGKYCNCIDLCCNFTNHSSISHKKKP